MRQLAIGPGPWDVLVREQPGAIAAPVGVGGRTVAVPLNAGVTLGVARPMPALASRPGEQFGVAAMIGALLAVARSAE